MAFDIAVHHPLYDEFLPSWTLMRDSFDGEDQIKSRAEAYLPTKTGIEALALKDPARAAKAYDAYKLRAEFPDLVALTVRGAVGTMLDKAAVIELPGELEPLREKATRDGLTLEALHRRIATEVMLTGRYGVLPGIGLDGSPYLAGYVAESIINWDQDDNNVADFVVLDESGYVRDRETNEWDSVERYRECFVENGRYGARVWTKDEKGWEAGEVVEAADRKRRPLTFLPFVFISTADLTPSPDDVPLYGLAKLAVRIYRMDADLTTSLHMTAEPTPMVSGYDDPAQAIKDGKVPQGIGASTLWVLPQGGDGKFLEFNGPGIQKQEDVIQKNYDRAVMFGAQMLADEGRAQESGEAKRVRLDSQHATLKGIAMTSAAGLEKALKNVATWIGADPEKVKVTPNLDFFDHTLSGQEIDAVVRGWQAGSYSWKTAFERLQKGGIIPEDRTPEEELELIDKDEVEREDDLTSVILPNRQPNEQE
ncbi:DUF4055 domain-containing protein [Shinella daejeonensis]|uniref:DUF4055 domain-containing protein n=1 Tax=Shinella daejeonensis TaxID=659017 RepID=UPI0020C8222C|nr:DUF4055 domain-containing protein [Shinella daejeonensis]MCP8895338.1 DUF4055 domain-containing protein [Shinella daejeonensis]